MDMPAFKPDEHEMLIEAVVNLPAWACMGDLVDFPRFRHLPQDGAIVIGIGDFDRGTAQPSAEESACVVEFLANAEHIRTMILEDLLARYEDIRTEYRDECGYEEGDEDQALRHQRLGAARI